MLEVLKIIGIIILCLIGIVVLFVICFIGRNLWNALTYMISYIGGTLRNVIFGGLIILIIIMLIIEICKG